MLVTMIPAYSGVFFDRRISGFYRIHDVHVREEHYLWNHDREYTNAYVKSIVDFCYDLLKERGITIPPTDDLYFDKLCAEIADKIDGKQVAIYGYSTVTNKVVSALQRRNSCGISFVADNPKYRKNANEFPNLDFPLYGIEELPSLRGQFNVILIACRNTEGIEKDLQSLGFSANDYVKLGL